MREQDQPAWGGDWESRRREQQIAGLRVSPRERIEWLVTMIELAWKTGALPKPRDAWGRLLPRKKPSGS